MSQITATAGRGGQEDDSLGALAETLAAVTVIDVDRYRDRGNLAPDGRATSASTTLLRSIRRCSSPKSIAEHGQRAGISALVRRGR